IVKRHGARIGIRGDGRKKKMIDFCRPVSPCPSINVPGQDLIWLINKNAVTLRRSYLPAKIL
ncbi:MAG: hypothetical protein RRA32_09850, partial [bacterium]|nr:hypothetical protein [bacterium]